MVGRSLLQLQTQKRANTQRVGRAPRDRSLGVQAFKVAEQQQPDVSAGRETRPSDDRRIERRARPFDEHIETGLVEHPVQSRVKRMRGAAWQVLRRDPHRRLTCTSFTFAHRHGPSVGHGIDRVDPYSATLTTGC